jgi:hypothetical protein
MTDKAWRNGFAAAVARAIAIFLAEQDTGRRASDSGRPKRRRRDRHWCARKAPC